MPASFRMMSCSDLMVVDSDTDEVLRVYLAFLLAGGRLSELVEFHCPEYWARPPKLFTSWTGVPSSGNGATLRASISLDGVDAMICVHVEQDVENLSGLGAVPGEDVALLDVLGPFAAGERLAGRTRLADEVEGVEVAAERLRGLRG